MIAPNFPDAADIPWHMVSMFVGKTSAGIRYVVQFGPHCPKNDARKTMTMIETTTSEAALDRA